MNKVKGKTFFMCKIWMVKGLPIYFIFKDGTILKITSTYLQDKIAMTFSEDEKDFPKSLLFISPNKGLGDRPHFGSINLMVIHITII